MNFPKPGTRVVVTGAAGGIGRALTTRLEAGGVRVCGIDLESSLERATGTVIVPGDVTDPASIRAAVEDAARRLGGIDALVCGAGIGIPQDAGRLPDREARRTFEVNFWGAWNTTAAALPWLLESHGVVVNVLSGLAVVSLPWSAAYSASKRALEAYSEVLALDYRGRLDVATVYPGYIRTGIHAAANARGVSLEGMTHAETVEQAAAGIARAIARRGGRHALSPRSALEFWLGRHFPAAVRRVVVARASRLDVAMPDFPTDHTAPEAR